MPEFGHHKFEAKAVNSGQVDWSDESKCLEVSPELFKIQFLTKYVFIQDIDADLFKGVKFLWKGVINNQKKWKNDKGEQIVEAAAPSFGLGYNGSWIMSKHYLTFASLTELAKVESQAAFRCCPNLSVGYDVVCYGPGGQMAGRGCDAAVAFAGSLPDTKLEYGGKHQMTLKQGNNYKTKECNVYIKNAGADE